MSCPMRLSRYRAKLPAVLFMDADCLIGIRLNVSFDRTRISKTRPSIHIKADTLQQWWMQPVSRGKRNRSTCYRPGVWLTSTTCYHDNIVVEHHSVTAFVSTRYYTSCPVVCEIHEGLASRRRCIARGGYHIQRRQRVFYLTCTKTWV